MSGVYWDAKRKARLRQVFAEKDSLADIAEAFPGKSVEAVRIQLRGIGLVMPRRAKLKWPPEQVEKFKMLCRQGADNIELAEMFSVTSSVINQARCRYFVTYKALGTVSPIKAGHRPRPAMPPRLWTEEEDAAVRRGHRSGYLALSVGNLIHRRGEEVMGRAVVLGLGAWPAYQPNQKGSVYAFRRKESLPAGLSGRTRNNEIREGLDIG